MINQDANNSKQFFFAVIIILLAALTRFIPHPFNFTAIGAIALFSGANIRDRKYAFLIPITIMFLSDLIIGFHFSILPVYACFSFAVWMGILIREKQNFKTIISSSILSSLVFFLITNLPLWYLDLKLYPMTIEGTLTSYQMALPFFRNQVIGDLFYNAILFGTFYLYFQKTAWLKADKIKR